MPEILGKLAEPIALIAWALVALVVVARRAKGGVRLALALMTLLAYLGLATPLGANWMVGLLENHAANTRDCGAPVPGTPIVVLAGGIDADVTSATETSRLALSSLRRVIVAARLAKDAPGSPVVMSGGGGSPVREADLMRALIVDLGIAPERVTLERDSRTTYENATGTRRLLTKSRSEKRIYLVTSAMHMPRAAAAFAKQGFDVCPIPADRRWDRVPTEHALIPDASALQRSVLAVHEFVGLLGYWIAGRIQG